MDIPSITGTAGIQTQYGVANADRLVSSVADRLNEASASKNDEQLMQACKDFESYFLQTMFRQMRGTSEAFGGENSLFAKSSGEKMFQDMLDEEVSKKASDTSGIGLASFLYRQMKREDAAKSDPINMGTK